MKKKWFILVSVVMLVMTGCGSKPTLAEMIESDEVLVLSYVFEDYQQLAGLSQSDMESEFSWMLSNLSGAANFDGLFKECEEKTGIPLKCIRMEIVNVDGAVLYSQEYVNTGE